MKFMDRYIVGNILKNLFYVFTIVLMLYILFDFVPNTDNFFKPEFSFSQSLILAGHYYFLRAIFLVNSFFSTIFLFACLLTICLMIRINEILPLLANGISYFRIFLPFFIIGLFFIFAAAGVREYILPQYIDELSQTVKELAGDKKVKMKMIRDRETEINYRAEGFYRKEKTILKPVLRLPEELKKFGSTLESETAVYYPPKKSRSKNSPAQLGGYLMQKVYAPKELLKSPSLSIDKKDVIITPVDAPDWLKPDECFVVSNYGFIHISAGENWFALASIGDLIKELPNKSLDKKLQTESTLNKRILQPFIDLVFLCFVLASIIRRQDKDFFRTLTVGSLLIILFMSVQFGADMLGTVTNLPVLGAWIPLIVFTPFVVILIPMLYKE